MKTYNCLIVEDEPLARELLLTFCNHLPSLLVAGLCGNVLEAKVILQEKRIDIIFLDIHLPVLNGIDFLRTLKDPPQVIMTTAYKEYAVSAFELAVCDYLVKPFSLDRFIIAVDRAMEHIRITSILHQKSGEDEDFIFIRTDGKIFKINYGEFLFAEANGNSTKVVTSQSVIVPLISFSGLSKSLPENQFIKTHRSFIVNKAKIVRIEGNRVFVGQYEIPIGRSYRVDFYNKIGL